MIVYLSAEKPRALMKLNGRRGSRLFGNFGVPGDGAISFSLPHACLGDSIPNGEYNFVGVRPKRFRERV